MLYLYIYMLLTLNMLKHSGIRRHVAQEIAANYVTLKNII